MQGNRIDRIRGGPSEMWTFPAPSRGWSVIGRAEAERRLDFSFSNFPPVSSGVESRREDPFSPDPPTLGSRNPEAVGQQPGHAP